MSKLERAFVWLGGAAFVGSLMVCAYGFVVRWSGDTSLRAQPVWQAILVDTALFAAFAAHHSFFARDLVKTWMSKIVPARLIRAVYVWTASLLLVLVVVVWRPIGGDLYRAVGWARYAHAAVQLAGIWLIVRSVRLIDALELAGIRAHDGPAVLHISGPYRFVRHPLYLGWILIVFGVAHMSADRAAFAAVTSLYLLIAIPWEERSLERRFGNAYTQYKQRVPWRVVPYLF